LLHPFTHLNFPPSLLKICSAIENLKPQIATFTYG
jgi:hypothetical protein